MLTKEEIIAILARRKEEIFKEENDTVDDWPLEDDEFGFYQMARADEIDNLIEYFEKL